MTASPLRRNKIRLIAIATTGVTPQGVAPTCFQRFADRLRCHGRERRTRRAWAIFESVEVLSRTRRRCTAQYWKRSFSLQAGRMIQELPGKFELCLQPLPERLHSEDFGRVVSGVK